MQALGLIETKGLLAAVESADAMLKAADVTLIEKTYVGGGLVTITITGDVGAVKAAVEAGGAAVRKINSKLLVSQHVIPRPHEELDCLIGSVKLLKNEEIEITQPVIVMTETESKEEAIAINIVAEDSIVKEFLEEKETISLEMDLDEINKEVVDKLVLEYGLEKAFEVLSKLKVTKLRTLAREYKSLRIAGRLISKADKKILFAEFKEYYSKN